MSDDASILRSHGLSVTAQRLAVLRAVRAAPHATAEKLIDAVRRELGTASRQSIYDALNTLTELGILRRIQPMGSTARYEARAHDNHHHIVCRSCGSVADVDCAIGRRPCLTPKQAHGYEIDEADVTYWGRCPTCQAASVNAPSAPRRSPSTTSAATPKERS